jgi:DNA-directed RNA polymerase subunit RPC12/RpoP
MTLKIQAGEYECAQCKKLTIIPRTKKSEEPLTCCGVEMVPKEKVKFTEPPAPKAEATAATATKTRTATGTRAKKATSKRPKKVEAIVEAVTLPLAPGNYMCPTCGVTKPLKPTDNRDKWLRCTDCYVKMLPA